MAARFLAGRRAAFRAASYRRRNRGVAYCLVGYALWSHAHPSTAEGGERSARRRSDVPARDRACGDGALRASSPHASSSRSRCGRIDELEPEAQRVRRGRRRGRAGGRRRASDPATSGRSPGCRSRSRTTAPSRECGFTYGCALMADHVADYDHNVTRRLKEAGFIVVGTTTLPEYGILPVTEARLFGPTRNPWDLERTPAAPPGGSAAAVASGMVPARARQRRRRLDSHPRGVLRAGRPQAQPRTRSPWRPISATRCSGSTACSRARSPTPRRSST